MHHGQCSLRNVSQDEVCFALPTSFQRMLSLTKLRLQEDDLVPGD